MDKNAIKIELLENEINSPEEQDDNTEELSTIIINTDLPDDPLNQNGLAGNVPLFIKKLWKMVNDDNAEEIIGWNTNGDGFVIHDQFKFISRTLPKYFKHNHLSSFVRQLNLYDFHKSQKDREEFQFSHPFFLKGIPQLLPFIKRKPPTGRHKSSTAKSSESSTELHSELQELLTAVKDMNTKSDSISNELLKLRQENAALWGEMNSLRVKYSKQTKIINKLIHFLISYMQKHHNVRKNGRTVSTTNENKYLKTGPKIMELDYRYKNNPHEFWTEYDNQNRNYENSEQEAYTVVEPAETNMELDGEAQNSEGISSPNLTVSSVIEELLSGSSVFQQSPGSSLDQSLPQIDYASSQPSSSKMSNSALQRAGDSRDNLGYLIDNTQIELNTIKELIKHLSPEELTNFYKLVNENCKNQEEEPLDIDVEPEGLENELMALAQMSPSTNIVQGQDIEMPSETNNINDLNLSIPLDTSDKTLEAEGDQNTLSISNDELLNPDDILNKISVDQYFN